MISSDAVARTILALATLVGAATVFFPFGSSAAGTSIVRPVYLFTVEAMFAAAYLAALITSVFDRYVNDHTRTKYLFSLYMSIVGLYTTSAMFYLHLSWYIRTPDVDTEAELLALTGQYVTEPLAAACAASIAAKMINVGAFLALLHADGAARARSGKSPSKYIIF